MFSRFTWQNYGGGQNESSYAMIMKLLMFFYQLLVDVTYSVDQFCTNNLVDLALFSLFKLHVVSETDIVTCFR